MKTIVIGDIHGCYDALTRLMKSLTENYDIDNDRIIFLGDYVDRGTDSRLVIKFIRELQNKNKNVIALMGNHENMIIDHYKYGDTTWFYNGFKATQNSYDGFKDDFKSDVEWMKSLPLYYEDDNFIYAHAGLDLTKPLNKQTKNTLLWIREDFIYSEIKYNKRIIYGHTPSLLMTDDTLPYSFNNNICIDTGCVFDGKLTALIIDNGEIEKFIQVEK